MSVKSRRYRCPKCGEVYDASHRVCPGCNVSCESVRVSKDVCVGNELVEEDLDEAETTFLSRVRRYKANDGKIDQAERNELVDLSLALGIDSVRRESLIEMAEREFEGESQKLKTGDTSDGRDRRLVFLDWRRWRQGPLRHVRTFVGKTRKKFLALGIVRSEDRGFGGVCSAIARRFAINIKLFRAIALAVAIACPYSIAAYFVFWSLLPNKGEKFGWMDGIV